MGKSASIGTFSCTTSTPWPHGVPTDRTARPDSAVRHETKCEHDVRPTQALSIAERIIFSLFIVKLTYWGPETNFLKFVGIFGLKREF